MSISRRTPRILHATSEPLFFLDRDAELALLDRVFEPGAPSVVAFVGPGGQGKTAIAQHWLQSLSDWPHDVEGIFLWSYYRGKESDQCLRELYAYVHDLAMSADVAASYCVDHLLPSLRGGRWIVILDGTEVVQYESGPWSGRFLHPELGRLLEELASAPLPGVVIITTRFSLPDLAHRSHARLVSLAGLDVASARGLLRSLGVLGTDAELDKASAASGFHAKAVELLGTYLAAFADGDVAAHRHIAATPCPSDMSDEEHKVAWVLAAYQSTLAEPHKDMLALATAFRDPPTEARLLEYLASEPVRALLHETWQRGYEPFREQPTERLAGDLQKLIDLRLLERVHGVRGQPVIDAHPLVRRAFEHVLGLGGRPALAQARAGFLRGRPERRQSASLEEVREEVELFHAFCDAGLWEEADGVVEGLDKPRYRFLAPAFERDLLLRFFPGGDWRQPPLWPVFTRQRSLAICLEMLGHFADALPVYLERDAALRGDALLALGRLAPLLEPGRPPHPWEMLWRAYQAHALALAGRADKALALASALVPMDVYEWTHVFECLLRLGQLSLLDMRSFLYRPPRSSEHRWNELARRRMRADYVRITMPDDPAAAELGGQFTELIEEYDRTGLPWERCLTRLGYCRWLFLHRRLQEFEKHNAVVLDLARRHQMPIMEADAWQGEADIAQEIGDERRRLESATRADAIRQATGYRGPSRP
jgi:hypothetical protein